MLRKKIGSAALALLLLLYTAFPAAALGKDSISAPSAVLTEASTGKILYEKNAHEKRPCASITKVMTLLLVMEALDAGKLRLDDTVTASEHASSMGGSDIWLEPGETMSADDMIKATVVASANDAAVALAEHLCGSEETFVGKMNQRAKELGMKDTTFKNCNGLDEEGHITSAWDVALMSRELMKHEKIFDYTSIWLDYLRGGKTQIVNTNKLLRTYNGITGLKTGTTDDAGCCMAASATRDGMTLVSVVLGCDTGKQRFADAATLLDDGFANYSVKELKTPKDLPKTVAVTSGMASQAALSCDVNASLVTAQADAQELKSTVELPESVEAPVKKGQVIGTLTFSAGKEKRVFPITAKEEIPAVSFGLLFSHVVKTLLSL